MVVGTKVQVGDMVKDFSGACGLFYVSERWLGGTFTNLETILKRLASFKELEAKKATGELEKYTKKERAKFDQKLKDFEIKFGGIKNLQKRSLQRQKNAEDNLMESLIHHPYPVWIYFIAGFLGGISFKYWLSRFTKKSRKRTLFRALFFKSDRNAFARS